MQPLEAFDRLVYVMVAIFAIKYRNKGFIEGHIEDPVHEQDHVSEQPHYVLRVVFAILQEIVHVKKEPNYSEQVKEAKDHEGPVEEGRARIVYGFDDSRIVAQLDDKVQEELIFPFKLIRFEKVADQLNEHHQDDEATEKQTCILFLQQLEHDVEETGAELRVEYLQLILFLLIVVFHGRRGS
ncbi:hypothetical protein FGO68_gene8455 [Halteria grandinella]|uniref:Uncharacterized protein n=1 Tax=Halteria grandinella TaxID=5974 RepID=A0A8J8SVN1_HALGN|nr:hypothetical protein FGO68_gene8455 [Halteria grandinella]